MIAGPVIALSLLAAACTELPGQGQPPEERSRTAALLDGRSVGARRDRVPPHVVAASPAPGETDVVLDVEVSVTFSEAIDPDTVHDASFSLLDVHERPVLGSLQVEGAEVTFVPTIDLTYREHYTVRITTEVTDLAGTPMAEEWRHTFSLHDSAFTGHLRLDAGNVSGPVPAVGDRAHGFIVWRRDASLAATHHVPNVGWSGTSVLLATGSNPGAIDVAAAREDRALAIWRDDSGIRATHFIPPGGWYRVSTLLAASGSEPRVGMDARGDGMAVWLQRDATHVGVFARRFRGPGWSTARRIDSAPADAGSLQFAMDHAGNGVALWTQAGNVWRAAFRQGRWEPAALLEQDAGDARAPRLVLDGDGRGMAFWIQHDGAGYALRWSRHEPQAGWSPPAFADGGPAVGADSGQWQTELAFSSHGDAVAVWHEQSEDCNPASPVPDPCAQVFARRFDLAHGWYEVEVLSEKHYENVITSRVASIDRHGTIWVAWSHVAPEIGTAGAWLSRYTPIYGWRPPDSMITDHAGYCGDIAIVASPQGRMLLTWRETRTQDEIFGMATY